MHSRHVISHMPGQLARKHAYSRSVRWSRSRRKRFNSILGAMCELYGTWHPRRLETHETHASHARSRKGFVERRSSAALVADRNGFAQAGGFLLASEGQTTQVTGSFHTSRRLCAGTVANVVTLTLEQGSIHQCHLSQLMPGARQHAARLAQTRAAAAQSAQVRSHCGRLGGERRLSHLVTPWLF